MLSDKDIEAIAKPFICDVGDHWSRADAIPDDGAIENFARAIAAEVRKQDTELIRQMLDVLEYVRNTPEDAYDSKAALDKAKAAITAARARLENT